MTQNIYDDDEFFAGYQRLPRSVDGLAGAPEWPVLRSFLPDLAAAAVVDLGCGFGWFCRWAESEGARSVLGLDVSSNMLERARADTPPSSAVEYRQVDLENLELAPNTIDCAYSSLTLHYIDDLQGVLRSVRAALVPGGSFVLSVEHPIFTAPTEPGFVMVDDRAVWPTDHYLDEGIRSTKWFADGVIKHHRTVGSYVSALVQAGFMINDLVEWGPSTAQISEHPEWSNERHRPAFLLLSCRATGPS